MSSTCKGVQIKLITITMKIENNNKNPMLQVQIKQFNRSFKAHKSGINHQKEGIR